MPEPGSPPRAQAPAEAPLPAPERCLHNLHRASDRRGGAPEATDLCANDLGVFHMLDCPLFLGRPCAWFAEAAEPHQETPDAAIAQHRDALYRDFLTWRYRRRVRALPLPPSAHRPRIAIERSPEDEAAEAADPAVALRPEVLAALAAAAPPSEAIAPEPSVPVAPAPETSGADEPAPAEGTSAPAPSGEMYPGQRRSEDRGSRKRLRRGPRPVPALPAVTLPPDEAEAELTPEDILPSEPAPPPPPKTVEELFAVLPEARLPSGPPRGDRRDGDRRPDEGRRGDGRRGDGRGGDGRGGDGRGGDGRRGDRPGGGRRGPDRGRPRQGPPGGGVPREGGDRQRQSPPQPRVPGGGPPPGEQGQGRRRRRRHHRSGGPPPGGPRGPSSSSSPGPGPGPSPAGPPA